MSERKLPYKAERIKPLEGKETFDSIIVYPESSGSLQIPGQFSKEKKHPKYRVDIHATNRSSVEYEEKLLGNAENYTLVVKIKNFNDSPATVHLEKAE